MKVLAFFVCDKAIPREQDDRWDIMGFPIHRLYSNKFPVDFSLTIFVEIASEMEPIDRINLGILLEDSRYKKLAQFPLEKQGGLWAVNGPLIQPCQFPLPGRHKIVLMYGAERIAEYPLIVFEKS